MSQNAMPKSGNSAGRKACGVRIVKPPGFKNAGGTRSSHTANAMFARLASGNLMI
jgi:hypothetical protein